MPRSSNSTSVKVDKYNNQAKVPLAVWLSIAGFFVVILGLLVIFTPNNQEKIYEAYTAYGVTTMPEDHPLYQVKYEGGLFRKGLEDILADEELVVVYFGFAACPGCQAHVTPISTYFTSTGMNEYVDKVYYLDVSQETKGFDVLRAEFTEIQTTTPQIAFFMNGELVEIYVATEANAPDATQINRNIRDFYNNSIDLINE